jgi:hypothetical protein
MMVVAVVVAGALLSSPSGAPQFLQNLALGLFSAQQFGHLIIFSYSPLYVQIIVNDKPPNGKKQGLAGP